MNQEIINILITKSREVLNNSYCPYSNFPVGAALLCEDSTIFTGCNVENAAYPMAICAERTAVVKAISEGHRKFKAIAVTTNMIDEFGTPCGNCRQFISEFGNDILVYLVKPNLSYHQTTIKELLPMSFGPNSLMLKRIELNNKNC